jgi:hypothetical protein
MLPIAPLLPTLRHVSGTLSRSLRWLNQAHAAYEALAWLMDTLSG